MEDYPEEIRVRPVPLVAFVGAGELAAQIERNVPVAKRHPADLQAVPHFRVASFEFKEPLPSAKRTASATGAVGQLLLQPGGVGSAQQQGQGSSNTLSPATAAAASSDALSRRISQDSRSFEPVGILKASWLSKFTQRRFAAILVFLDWDAPDFKVREPEIYNTIDTLKTTARNLQVALVLVRKDATVDVNEERYALFKKRVNIDSKLIIPFVRDDFSNSSQRLEALAVKMSAEFFDSEGKYLKKQKERLINSMHQRLYARNHFKIARFAEFRNDSKIALKYYYSCYGYLKDAKKQPSDYLEIKTLADFVNFKVCWLYFERGTGNDAVSHFHRHIAYYRTLVEPEREFQHLAWLSRQYRVFGELLEAFPTQISAPPRPRGWFHPGFYYQTAASLQMDRAKAAERICGPQRSDPSMVALLGKVKPFNPAQIDPTKQIYVGQNLDNLALDQANPLQAALLDGAAPANGIPTSPLLDDPSARQEHALRIAVAQELNVKHADVAIDLLKKAQNVYELDLYAMNQINPGVLADRTHMFVLAQLGHLYAHNGHPERAMDLLLSVAKRHRAEKWWDLLTEALSDMLLCSKRLGNCVDIVHYSLELMSKQMKTTHPVKQSIQADLLSMVWPPAGVQSPLQLPLVITMGYAHPLIMCQVQFEQDTACVHAEVHFNVVLQVEFPDPIRFSALKVHFTNAAHNQRLVDHAASGWRPGSSSPEELQNLSNTEDNLLFVPSKQKIFKFNFVVRDQSRIQCAAVVLELGEKPHSLRFQWDVLNHQPNRAERRGSFSTAATGMSVSQYGASSSSSPTISSVATAPIGQLQSPSLGPQSSKHLHPPPAKRPHSRQTSASKFDFLAPHRSSIEILEHEAFLEIEIEHEEPALVKEFYPMRIRLVNKHDKIMTGKLHISNLTDHKDRCFFMNGVTEQGHPTKTPVEDIELPQIENGETHTFLLHFYPKAVDDRTLKFKVTYDTEKYSTHCEKVISIPVKQALVANFEIYSSQFRLLQNLSTSSAQQSQALSASMMTESVSLASSTLASSAIPAPPQALTSSTVASTTVPAVAKIPEPPKPLVGEPFYLRVDVQSSVSFTLQLLKIDLLSLSGAGGAGSAQITENSSSYSATETGIITLPRDDKYTIWFSLTPMVAGSIDLGSLLVEWRRRSHIDPFPNATVTKLDIPALQVDMVPYSVDVSLPSRVCAGIPFEHQIVVKNITNSLQEFTLEVDSGSGDDFAVAGDVDLRFKVAPQESYILLHTLLPLRIGRLPLPKFYLQLTKSDRDYAHLAEERFVFVEPSPRGAVPLLL